MSLSNNLTYSKQLSQKQTVGHVVLADETL